MLYRNQYLLSRYTLGDSGTHLEDLNVRDPVTALWVEFRMKNGGTNNQANTVAQNIQDIEIIDGGEVLCKINGAMALALTRALLKNTPYQLVTEVASNNQNLSVIIPFGRFLGDPEYALDPSRFRNLQIRLTWNAASVNSVGATGFLTGNVAVTVMPLVMEGAPQPRAMLIHKEIYEFTTASSGIEHIDLPTDYPYRSILIRADKAATQIFGVVSNVKMTCDAGKFVPFDMRMSDLVRWASQFVPPLSYKHVFSATDGDTIYAIAKQDETLSPVAEVGDTVIAYQNYGMGEGPIVMTTGGSGDSADKAFAALVTGWCPYRTQFVPFGNQMDAGDWFPAPSYGSVRLELTNAAASGTGTVVLTQARPY